MIVQGDINFPYLFQETQVALDACFFLTLIFSNMKWLLHTQTRKGIFFLRFVWWRRIIPLSFLKCRCQLFRGQMWLIALCYIISFLSFTFISLIINSGDTQGIANFDCFYPHREGKQTLKSTGVSKIFRSQEGRTILKSQHIFGTKTRLT